MTFGANVQRLRKQRDMSQVELAEKLNVKQTDISRWERGAVPSLDTIIRVGMTLHASVDDLLCGIDPTYDGSRLTRADRQRPTPPTPELTDRERELIGLWNAMPKDEQRGLLTLLRSGRTRAKQKTA